MVCRPLPAGCGPSPCSAPRWCWSLAGYLLSAAAARATPAPAAARLPGGHRGGGHPARGTDQAGIAATIAGRRGPAPAAPAGGHHRLRGGPAGIEAAEPGLRRPRFRGRVPAAPLAGLGHHRRARGPRLRHHEVLRRPGPGAAATPRCRSTRRPRTCSTARTGPPTSSGPRWPSCWPATSPAPQPHGVSCWYSPSGKADLAGAVRQLTETFGPQGQGRGAGGGHHGPFGKKERGERRGRARAAGRGLDGGRAGWWRTPSTTASARYGTPVMCGPPQMAAGLAARPADRRAQRRQRQYCRGLTSAHSRAAAILC